MEKALSEHNPFITSSSIEPINKNYSSIIDLLEILDDSIILNKVVIIFIILSIVFIFFFIINLILIVNCLLFE